MTSFAFVDFCKDVRGADRFFQVLFEQMQKHGMSVLPNVNPQHAVEHLRVQLNPNPDLGIVCNAFGEAVDRAQRFFLSQEGVFKDSHRWLRTVCNLPGPNGALQQRSCIIFPGHGRNPANEHDLLVEEQDLNGDFWASHYVEVDGVEYQVRMLAVVQRRSGTIDGMELFHLDVDHSGEYCGSTAFLRMVTPATYISFDSYQYFVHV